MSPAVYMIHMPPLTTRQRDILHTLLQAKSPIATSAIADSLDVTARQISYSLKGLKRWLAFYGASLNVIPGVGVKLLCNDQLFQSLSDDVVINAELVLTADQRRQILIFVLLNHQQHHILDDFQTIIGVSRTTVLKDLDAIDGWLKRFNLTIERKSNYGVWLSGAEQKKRFALAALYSGDMPFADTLWEISYSEGMQFRLSGDTHLLSILQEINQVTLSYDMRLGMEQIARAEANLGMQFSDHAVLYLALAFAIQAQRFAYGNVLDVPDVDVEMADTDWLMQRPVWAIATEIVPMFHDHPAEIASCVTYLLAGAKLDRWQGDVDLDVRYMPLIDTILHQVSVAYELATLRHDTTLRDSLIANLVPAFLRVRFQLYLPSQVQEALSAEKYAFEYRVAQEIITTIDDALQMTLPAYTQINLVMLLRAAYIRARPKSRPNVIVVCPSGMATAQLLVARLKARFARLGHLRVVSVRDLSNGINDSDSDLIITTVPLPTLETAIPILQVHPHLSVDDITQITEWLAT